MQRWKSCIMSEPNKKAFSAGRGRCSCYWLHGARQTRATLRIAADHLELLPSMMVKLVPDVPFVCLVFLRVCVVEEKLHETPNLFGRAKLSRVLKLVTKFGHGR
mmetsp:Transcript_1781/g.3372  ORF Transcript_1781/g.3372 Transcript_1781/m.3372 type:complete len:104 (+) Transcript_1781:55-366(+)